MPITNQISGRDCFFMFAGFCIAALLLELPRGVRYEFMNAKSKEAEAIVWRLDRKTGGINFCRYSDEQDNVYCGKVEYPAE